MAKKKEEVPSGVTSFLDVRTVHGYKVKEWTTEQFCLLYPDIKRIVNTLKKEGATFENISTYLTGNFDILGDAVIPSVPSIIKISCPENTQEDYDKLPWPAAIQLTMIILKINMEHLADFFGQSPV